MCPQGKKKLQYVEHLTATQSENSELGLLRQINISGQDSFSSISTTQHCKRKPGFFISDEKQTWISCIFGPHPPGASDSMKPKSSAVKCAKLQPEVTTCPRGTDPQMSFSTGPCVTRFTFGGKRPCSWEKVAMTQIPQTN